MSLHEIFPSFLTREVEDRDERSFKMVPIDIISKYPRHALLTVLAGQIRLLDCYHLQTASKALTAKVAYFKSSGVEPSSNFDLRKKDGVVYIELKFQVLMKWTTISHVS